MFRVTAAMSSERRDPSNASRDSSAAQGVGAIRFAARAGAVLVALFCVAIGYWTWIDSNADFRVTYTPMVELGANATDNYFRGMERSLKLFSDELMGAKGFRADRAQAALERFLRQHPDFVALAVIDTKGTVVAATVVVPVVANDPHDPRKDGFPQDLEQLRNGDKMVIGRPRYLAHLDDWGIPLQVAMRERDGTVRFVLSAALPLSRPYGLWKDAPLPQGGALGLYRDDGYLATQYPIPSQRDMNELFGFPRRGALVRHLREHDFPAGGSITGFSVTMNQESVYVFRRLAHYPFTFYFVAPTALLRSQWLATLRPFMLAIGLFALAGWVVYRSSLGRQKAWAAENQRARDELERVSRLDFLTDALNRRAFYVELEKELSRSKRERQPTALIALDLDYFKSVNDRHGHLAGDEALRQFVRATRAELRPYDVLGRFGGEEFMVLLPNTSNRDARVIAERIRERLQRDPIGPDRTVVTVSAGVADSLEAEVDGNFVQLIAVADRRLYLAKHDRNTVASGA